MATRPPTPSHEAAGASDAALEEHVLRRLRAHAQRLPERLGPGAPPRLFWSPGRVNLMGAHLDYNGGPVLPTAIDRGTFVAVRPRADRRLVLASMLDQARLEVDLEELPERAAGAWTDYPLGVAARVLALAREAGSGRPSGGLDVLYGGDLPVGAGLSSSASICVGTAFALDAVWELGLDAGAHLDAALWGERCFVGVQCGIMDPYAVRLTRPGHLLWIDCKDESIEHVPFDAARTRIFVADTGVRRELAAGEFNRRVAECAEAFERLRPHAPGATTLRDVPLAVVEERLSDLPPAVGRRALHVATEVARTFHARDALVTGDLAEFGRCITDAHASLRDLYEVSIPELDVLVDSASEWPGCHGARLTGAGFGGCIVAIVEESASAGFGEHLSAAFTERFGRAPAIASFRGAGGPREVRV